MSFFFFKVSQPSFIISKHEVFFLFLTVYNLFAIFILFAFTKVFGEKLHWDNLKVICLINEYSCLMLCCWCRKGSYFSFWCFYLYATNKLVWLKMTLFALFILCWKWVVTYDTLFTSEIKTNKPKEIPRDPQTQHNISLTYLNWNKIK